MILSENRFHPRIKSEGRLFRDHALVLCWMRATGCRGLDQASIGKTSILDGAIERAQHQAALAYQRGEVRIGQYVMLGPARRGTDERVIAGSRIIVDVLRRWKARVNTNLERTLRCRAPQQSRHGARC